MRRFRRLVSAHRDRVYSFAHYYLGNSQDAEDVTQIVLVKLWQHREDLDEDRIASWLTRVTRNACIDSIRKVRTYSGIVHTDSENRSFSEAQTNTSDPEKQLEASQLGAEIKQAIANLAEPYRTIVILREIEDLTYDTISETLEMPLNTVKVYLHRARKMLRAALSDVVRDHSYSPS